MTFGHLTHTLSPNTLWDVRVGRFVYAEGRSQHWRFGDAESLRPLDGRQQRRAAADRRADAHSYDSQSHTHPLPAGAAWRRSRVENWHGRSKRGSTGSHQSFRPASGTSTTTGKRFKPSLAIPRRHGGQFKTAALFATDAITIGERLTINAGVRFDHSRAISQDLHAIDPARAVKHGESSMASARCTPGTWCRHAWASRPSSPATAERSCGQATGGSTRAY